MVWLNLNKRKWIEWFIRLYLKRIINKYRVKRRWDNVYIYIEMNLKRC
jgi:hypothetical protein